MSKGEIRSFQMKVTLTISKSFGIVGYLFWDDLETAGAVRVRQTVCDATASRQLQSARYRGASVAAVPEPKYLPETLCYLTVLSDIPKCNASTYAPQQGEDTE